MKEEYRILPLGADTPVHHGLIYVGKKLFKKIGRIHGLDVSPGDSITLIDGKDKLKVVCKGY
jgi:hypothetical protein